MKTPHVHAAMIKEWAEDTSRVVESYCQVACSWLRDYNPLWLPNHKYRFRHKHQDLIDQKAARPKLLVEIKNMFTGDWECTDEPMWNEERSYRIIESRHKHQVLIDRKKERPELIVEYKDSFGSWNPITYPARTVWNERTEYRLVEPRHKHQDLIDRKKERPELIVEQQDSRHEWRPTDNPRWHEDMEYRLVEPPKQKKTVKMWQWVVRYGKNADTVLTGFYDCEAKMLYEWRGVKVIQRADWTEIEVEVPA